MATLSLETASETVMWQTQAILIETGSAGWR